MDKKIIYISVDILGFILTYILANFAPVSFRNNFLFIFIICVAVLMVIVSSFLIVYSVIKKISHKELWGRFYEGIRWYIASCGVLFH